jgi:valyl-tRNA synthetase
VKARARGDDEGGASARRALRLGLGVLLRLFAPVLPYITEEVWSWAFTRETGSASIHRAPWPGAADFAAVAPPAEPASFDTAVACLAAINKARSEAGVSGGRAITRLALAANAVTLARLAPVSVDVRAAARVERCDLRPRADLADGAFEVVEPSFAEATEA